MDELLVTSGVVVLVFSVIYYHVKKFTFWSSRGVSGPMPLPFFGTNYFYMIYNKVEIEEKWAKTYGRTYGVYQGYRPILKTQDNELVKQLHIKQFGSATDRYSAAIYGDQIGRWLFFSRGDHWANQRALISPLFTSSKMRIIVDKMSASVERFLQELNSKLKKESSAKSAGVLIDRGELMSVTMDSIAHSFFSLKIDTYKDKASEFYKRAFKFADFDMVWSAIWLLIPAAICRYFKIDFTPPDRYEYFDKLSQRTIEERRRVNSSKAKTETKSDVIQFLLDARLADKHQQVYTNEDDLDSHYNDNEKHSKLEEINRQQSERAKFRNFDDNEIKAHMTFFFLAGFETTSSSLSFCFLELGQQQAAQEEVYQELLDQTKHLGHQVSDYSHLLSLKKLDAFISESLRLYNPVTLNERVVTAKEGIVLESSNSGRLPIALPFGTVVHVNGFLVQRDPEYWNDPLKFDMSRFYPENKDRIKSCTYMPFGVGPRNCVGMRFALLEMKLLLANTLLKYRVAPGPKSQVYPPRFKRHLFFLQLVDTDFMLVPRERGGNLPA